MKMRFSKTICVIVAIAVVAGTTVSIDARRKKHNNRNENRTEKVEKTERVERVDNSSSNIRSLTDVKINSKYRNTIKRYEAMTVNFNTAYRVPNCVSYVLTADMVKITDGPNAEMRRNYKFNRDASVAGCPEWWEYKKSGYDRGHMAPANDMRWSRQSMLDCFLMTNICPQDHNLNGGSWNKLELKVHAWAKSKGIIIIATGPVFNGTEKRIGNDNNIVVPSGFFKVVLDPNRNRAIGFIYDNFESGGGVKRHACSVDDVERITGHDFFSALPDNVERAVESTYNFEQW